jgi:hypothetical protein
MPGKGAARRGKARLQRGQCKTLAALFLLHADDIVAGSFAARQRTTILARSRSTQELTAAVLL